MKLQEYINVLQSWLDQNPEAASMEVVMTQEGYYSEDVFADLYDEPEIETIKTKKRDESGKAVYSNVNFYGRETKVPVMEAQKFVVLGNSYQSY